jgi:hypothetical protein
MEYCIKNNVNEITYQSELILDIFDREILSKKCQGFNSHL